MGGQYGVENTKLLLDFVFVCGAAVKNATADGKVDMSDLAQLMPVFAAGSMDFNNVGMVPKELTELDEADAGEIVAFAQQRLPGVLDKASLIRKVNAGLKVGLALVSFLGELKKEDMILPAPKP